MTSKLLSPELVDVLDARVLDDTESALGEFMQAALNIGILREQLAAMLRDMADKVEKKETLQ